jgi:hypothetical protein
MGLITKEAEENQDTAKNLGFYIKLLKLGFNGIRLIFRNGCEGS